MPDSDPVRKSLATALTLLLIIYAVAVPFFMHFEGLSIVDAIYFTSVSVTTVGYGDITPKTDIGKMFTILLIFSGVSIIFYHITHLGQFREKALDKQLMSRLSIFKTLTSIRDRRSDEKPPKFIHNIGTKIGEV